MRTALALAAALALAGAAAAAVADPPPPPNPALVQAKAEVAQAQAAILAFYPADARAKGVEGDATLACRRTPHGGLVGCTVAAETPADQGFGAAALAIAGQAPEEAGVNVPADEVATAHPISFRFRLKPPSIEPNLLLRHVIQPRAWVAVPPPVPGGKPPPARFYPEAAQRKGVEGDVIISCAIGPDGAYGDCALLAESPAGWDFGRTALRMTALFKAKPPPNPGTNTRVTIPIHFKPPG